MYTALSLGVELKQDTPQHVIDVIRQMVAGPRHITSHPSHKFFNQCDRWQFLFSMDSYYFDWQTGWTFERDDISESWFLSGVSNLKNYSGEIGLFLDWVQPYLMTPGFIGWSMYEESVVPTILYNTSAGIKQIEGEYP